MHYGEMLEEGRYRDLIRLAYEAGIRTFVTADVYGAGRADAALGEALAGLERESYCLVGMVGHDFEKGAREGSKGYPRFTHPDLRGPRDYASYLREASEKSLERCRAAKFDLVMLHNPDEIGYTHEAVWEGMESVREGGLTEGIGIAPGPANGFVTDLIHCFRTFGSRIDGAMLILNPLEPWPQRHVLPVAEERKIDVLTRVVDYGGIFHGDVRPGHVFKGGDHRGYRPEGWVETGSEKLERMRRVVGHYGLPALHLAGLWNLGMPAVKSLVPTFIQETGESARPIEDKIREFAALPEGLRFTPEEMRKIEEIGENAGCMALKGASTRYQGPQERADQWPMREELLTIAQDHALDPSW